ncbi:4-hydroxy-tetrahydrodipicolinate synthase [Bradyrhizobium sp. Tv2a-2]|uniref:4-hydroxy-tetrahydrodipicolinate synthase n=1 Tax=Bradyrhizobium sp. Tv2a-2 TaxID=113395 RepID=UPI0003F52EDF|nr:4-hydroxy-tetrahydrodipicolinate synthase [Bradyrhizobium sp. Tv2a-2]
MISSKLYASLAGCIPDLPTPFDEDGEIDDEAFARLCARQIAAGAPALVVGETAGEASTLSAAEDERLIRTAVAVSDGRVHVIAGAGSNSTGQAIELARRAEAAGADAVMSVVPYYNKPMQEGIAAHFQAIALSTGLPIILHDVPSRTVRELADDTLLRLAERRQFIGLRDGTSDVTRPLRLSGRLPDSFRLLSGDDATALAYVAAGGDGSISAVCNVTPDLCHIIHSSLKQGRMQTARYLQRRLGALQTCLGKESPAALKYALSLLGVIRPTMRLPLVELDEPSKAAVASALADMDDEELPAAADA